MDLDESDSGSEPESDQDTTSTTSYEDFTKLHPDMLLYKAAQARNLPVMLEALAQQADINWHIDDNDGKTPLIKAVDSVSVGNLI
jgi:Arf-GAP/coiled-coil/ANK repeat/PH domain-containing protein